MKHQHDCCQSIGDVAADMGSTYTVVAAAAWVL